MSGARSRWSEDILEVISSAGSTGHEETMRWFLLLFALLAAGVLAWEFIPIQVTVWDGGFDLTVHVSSTAGPLRAVSCQAYGQREDAEAAVQDLVPPRMGFASATADPFDGRPLTVNVHVSGRLSPFGRELARFQYRHLVVIGQLKDGRRIGKRIEIPDGCLSREVRVSLP
jgi:hypothetical protein